jgi:hypothetical protein
VIQIANEAVGVMAKFEQELKTAVRQLERASEELNKEPLLPADVCHDVAREVGMAAGKGAFDALALSITHNK